jgi:predicted Fe-Mo cluster-binding NifX family protein
MKVLITAFGSDITAPIDPRFERCRFFLVWDSSTAELASFANKDATGSVARISSVQFAFDHDVQMVITGEAGPHAKQVLRSAGVLVRLTKAATVSEALERLMEENNT